MLKLFISLFPYLDIAVMIASLLLVSRAVSLFTVTLLRYDRVRASRLFTGKTARVIEVSSVIVVAVYIIVSMTMRFIYHWKW